MAKFMRVNFNCPCMQTYSCLIAWYTATWILKIHQLYEFVVYTISQSDNETIDAKILLNLLMYLALVHKLRWLKVSSKSFALYFLNGAPVGIYRNGIFCTWATLFVFLASYLGTYCDSSHQNLTKSQMLDPLQMVNKLMQICKDIDWAIDSKNKMWLPS